MDEFISQLKSLTRCCICVTQFQKKIFLCVNGHDICESCRKHCNVCPMCRSEFSGGRNYSLEEVTSFVRNNENELKPRKIVSNTLKNVSPAPKQGGGGYTCRVPGCTEILPICRIINHCRWIHSSIFYEVDASVCTPFFYHQFTISDSSNSDLTRIYRVPRFGLFYLRFTIIEHRRKFYKLFGWVQIAAPLAYAKTLRYELRATLPNTRHSFANTPTTTKVDAENVIKSEMCLIAYLQNHGSMTVDFKITLNKGVGSHRGAHTAVETY